MAAAVESASADSFSKTWPLTSSVSPLRNHVRQSSGFAATSEEKELGRQRMVYARDLSEPTHDVTTENFEMQELLNPRLHMLDDIEPMEGWDTPSQSSQAGEQPDLETKRHAKQSSVLCDAAARHEEGVRRLRRGDFLGAAQLLEAAWDLVEAEFPHDRASSSSPRSSPRRLVESARGGAAENRIGKITSGRQSRNMSKTPQSADRSTPLFQETFIDIPLEVAGQEDGSDRLTEEHPSELLSDCESEHSPGSQQHAESLGEKPYLAQRRPALGLGSRAISRGASVNPGTSPMDLVAAEGDLQRALIEAAQLRVAAGSRGSPTTPKPDTEPVAEESASGKGSSLSNTVTEKRAKLPILLDLMLAFARLQRWERVDATGELALNFCGKMQAGLSGRAHHDESDEHDWVLIMVRRGVACAFLGPEQFQRGQNYFEEVLKIQPRNRDAKRGTQCMKFLKAQLPLGGTAYEEALAAMSGVMGGG